MYGYQGTLTVKFRHNFRFEDDHVVRVVFVAVANAARLSKATATVP